VYLVIYSFVTNFRTAPSDWMATFNGLETIQGDSAGNIDSFRGDIVSNCEKIFEWLTKWSCLNIQAQLCYYFCVVRWRV